ncbi:MAG: hypothetical protein WCS56_06325, partial [Bacilli bacterium]
ILKVLYNREFTKGYLLGDNALKIMNNDFNNHQGLLLGYAFENGKDLKIKLDHDLSINDGIRSIKNNRGYIVNSIYINDKKVLEAQMNCTPKLVQKK